MRSQRPTSSGSSVEREQDDAAVGRHLADQAVDLALGADIDAAGRVVEEEDLRRDLQPLADDDLLLVAARELVGERPGRARLDLEVVDLALRPGIGAARCGTASEPPVCAPTNTWLMLKRMLFSSIRPLRRRSAGTRQTPRRAASVGLRGRPRRVGEGRPRRRAPSACRRACASSAETPEPSRPARPITSPARGREVDRP